MDIPDLSFYLDIDCQADFADLRRWMREEWSDLLISWHGNKNTGETEDNWVEIGRNYGFDPKRINNPDGWFYYPFYIFVSTRRNPEPAEDDYSRQLDFARKLVEKLREQGCTVKVQAEFEDMP